MLLLKIFTLVMTIPLASQYLSTILFRFAFLIFLPGALLSEILGGLFQLTLFSQSPLSVMGSLLFLEEPEMLFSMFVPIMVYSNLDSDKPKILADNKGKAGIYMWTYKNSNKTYVGSAYDLSLRLKYYFNKSYLEHDKNLYICNALLHYSYSSFSLTIFEYIKYQEKMQRINFLTLFRDRLCFFLGVPSMSLLL